MKKKFRLDFSAHTSVVVEVELDDDDAMEEEAIKIAENYLEQRGVDAEWDLDDGGIEDVDDSEEAINQE